MKLGLGTVQFGVTYGISNTTGRPSDSEVASILNHAADADIQILDTATGYGDAEQVLGRHLLHPNPFRIVTKTPVFHLGPVAKEAPAHIRNALVRSVEKLRVRKLYGLLVHHADDLLSPVGPALVKAMRQLVDEGLVERIGVSLYTGDQIDGVLERFSPDIVQLPVSIADRRLEHSGHLSRLKSAGIEVHARSAFLQGALLMRPESLPGFLQPLGTFLGELDDFGARRKLSRIQLALAYLRDLGHIDHAIVGVTSTAELDEITREYRNLPHDLVGVPSAPALASCILDPSQWPKATAPAS